MSWVISTHSALLFCGQIQAYLVRIRLNLASAGLHLACWKSDDWVRLVTLPMPNFRGNSWMPMLCQCCVIAMSEWEVLRASAQPPLCEHDVSCILGLRWDHRESSSSKARNLQKGRWMFLAILRQDPMRPWEKERSSDGRANLCSFLRTWNEIVAVDTVSVCLSLLRSSKPDLSCKMLYKAPARPPPSLSMQKIPWAQLQAVMLIYLCIYCVYIYIYYIFYYIIYYIYIIIIYYCYYYYIVIIIIIYYFEGSLDSTASFFYRGWQCITSLKAAQNPHSLLLLCVRIFCNCVLSSQYSLLVGRGRRALEEPRTVAAEVFMHVSGEKTQPKREKGSDSMWHRSLTFYLPDSSCETILWHPQGTALVASCVAAHAWEFPRIYPALTVCCR